VEINEPALKVTEVEPRTSTGSPGENNTGCCLDRPGEVLKRLRLERLNAEERKQREKIRLDYQDIFHLPGEMQSSTTAGKPEIRLEPSTEPVIARPYRLPESQKQDVKRQVEELTRGVITTESTSSWNSRLLVVSKKSRRYR
jgi:hypothetical protein